MAHRPLSEIIGCELHAKQHCSFASDRRHFDALFPAFYDLYADRRPAFSAIVTDAPTCV